MRRSYGARVRRSRERLSGARRAGDGGAWEQTCGTFRILRTLSLIIARGVVDTQTRHVMPQTQPQPVIAHGLWCVQDQFSGLNSTLKANTQNKTAKTVIIKEWELEKSHAALST